MNGPDHQRSLDIPPAKTPEAARPDLPKPIADFLKLAQTPPETGRKAADATPAAGGPRTGVTDEVRAFLPRDAGQPVRLAPERERFDFKPDVPRALALAVDLKQVGQTERIEAAKFLIAEKQRLGGGFDKVWGDQVDALTRTFADDIRRDAAIKDAIARMPAIGPDRQYTAEERLRIGYETLGVMAGSALGSLYALVGLKAGSDMKTIHAAAVLGDLVGNVAMAVGAPADKVSDRGAPAREGQRVTEEPTINQRPERVGYAEAHARRNPDQSVGRIGEGARLYELRLRDPKGLDLNDLRHAFPGLDFISRSDGVEQTKNYGLPPMTPAGMSRLPDRLATDFQQMTKLREPGAPPGKMDQASTEIHRFAEQIQAAGAWPRDLRTDATIAEIGRFITETSKLYVPADLVQPVRDLIRTQAEKNPEMYGLPPATPTPAALDALTDRIRSSGLTIAEMSEINHRVHHQ
jgi:hypothetical protein